MRRARTVLFSLLLGACAPAAPPPLPACTADASNCLLAALDRAGAGRDRVELLAGLFARGAELPLAAQLRLRVGDRLLRPAAVSSLRAAGEARGEDWTPPLATAVVYLWARGTTPPGVRSGVSFLAESLPPGARVCPKSYGQNHYEAACLPAHHIAAGALVDDQQPGQFVHFLKASERALVELLGLARALAQDGRQPLRWMVIVTDGRDHQNGGTEGDDARRQTRQDFAALGARLRAAGVFVQVVSFPCTSDPLACHDNVAALVQAAGAAHLEASEPHQVEEKIRRAALVWSEMKWLSFDLPWYLRLRAAPIRLEAQVAGQTLALPVATLAPGATRARLAYALPAALAVALLLGSLRRRGSAAPADRGPSGTPRARAAVPAALAPEPAARRVFAVIAEAMAAGLNPRRTSRRMRALLAAGEWSAFSAATPHQLQTQLAAQRPGLPALNAAAAGAFVAETQRELREDLARPIAAAWLVDGAGQTFRLPLPAAVVGGAPPCDPCIADLAPEHAEIALARGRFRIRARGGPVLVGGRSVAEQHELTDGDVLQLGRARLVFKAVTSENPGR
jgi:hypothetical protein